MEIQKIYFDMDGVLADFDRGVRELADFEPFDQAIRDKKRNDELWDAIRKVDHFYDKLEMIDGAFEMFIALKARYRDKCEILSAIPKPYRGISTSREDKISWVRRLLGTDIKANIVYRAEKQEFAKGPGYILVDDLAKNIEEWEEAGGTGIKFENPEDVVRLIEGISLTI